MHLSNTFSLHLIMCLILQRSKSPWSKRCSGELIVLAHRNGAAVGPRGRNSAGKTLAGIWTFLWVNNVGCSRVPLCPWLTEIWCGDWSCDGFGRSQVKEVWALPPTFCAPLCRMAFYHTVLILILILLLHASLFFLSFIQMMDIEENFWYVLSVAPF